MTSSSSSCFFSFLNEIAAYFGASSFKNSEKDQVQDQLTGNIEFKSKNGYLMRLQIEQEDFAQWPALRARIIFGFSVEEKKWCRHQQFLESFFLCRLLPGADFPVVAGILPGDEYELQCVFSFNQEAKKHLLSFVSFASDFYQQAVSHAGAGVQIDSLKNYDDCLLLATETTLGIVTIPVGNASEFIGVQKILPMLLKLNSITFLTDHYYIGFDARKNLLLMALLPPAKKEQTDLLLAQLLQRVSDVRSFVMAVTTHFEVQRMATIFKEEEGAETLVLT